jgi:ABC-type lipoprotein release transport system permease subunit
VIAVAVVSASLVTSLGLLVSATEQGGVSTALSEIPDAQRTMEVILVAPTVNATDARAATDAGIADILGEAGTAVGTGIAISDYAEVPNAGLPVPVLTYFGEYDGLMDHTTLVEGEWATGDGDVAIPAAGAEALGLELGDEFTIRTTSSRNVTLTIVGLFRANDRDEDFWTGDNLHGEGNVANFPDPNVNFYSPTNTLGPLVGPPGSLDDPRWIAIDYLPDFETVTVDGVQPLLDRLDSADIDLSRVTASVSSGTFYASDVAEAVSGVTSSLVVTRSTVVVVSLLLVVLALAAMAQTARLFTEARDGERQLMRSRGASERHLLALGAIEAVFIGLVTALVSPLVANLVYRGLAAQPALVAARMPADAGIPPLTWATGAAVAALFVIVLLLPQLGRARTFVAGEQARGRPRVASGIMRSGVDVVLVIIAGLAFWQLRSYQSPVDTDDVSLQIDPILAAGPALMLLAAGLVCVRLIPASSRLLQRLGARRRGAVAPLAAWEIGRRSQRATAAVLLLSLTLAVGTFSLAFLETWKQSQVDQAQLAVGAPGRAAAGDPDVTDGAIGNAEPVIRRLGLVGYSQGGEEVPGGSTAHVLGLSDRARDLAARGRLGDEGGRAIAALAPDAKPSTGVELGAGGTLTATVRVQSADALPGVSVALSAVVENAQGVLSVSEPVSVVVDGSEHPLEWTLPAGSTRLVALQTMFGKTDPEADPAETDETTATVLVKDLATTEPLEVPQEGWAPSNRFARFAAEPGWPLGLNVSVPAGVQAVPASFALIGWIPQAAVSAILTGPLAEQIGGSPGASLTIFGEGAAVRVYVAAVEPVVPGTAATADLTSSVNNAAGASAIIVDQTLLARAYIEQGSGQVRPDEWWVDLAPGTGAAYERAHEGSRTAEVLATELQEAPLRVGTQAALWLAILAGAVLAAMGFAAHSIATLRARRLELAQLRAIGFSRRRLVGLLATESLIMSALGTIFGVGIGLLLVWLVGPLVAVSPSGNPPVPSVELHVPWLSVLLLVAEIIVVLGLIVVAVARVQRFVEPAALLREGSTQ